MALREFSRRRLLGLLFTALCSEGPMFRRAYVQMVLCSEGPMFGRFCIQKVLCSEGPMFRNICSEGPMFKKYG